MVKEEKVSGEVDYLHGILKPLVKYPESLVIEKITDDRGVLLTVKSNPVDAPVLIGKQGQFAKALRTIMRTYGSRIDALLHIKIDSTRDRGVENSE